jgi:tetratricopeptide (TPR) repeat protein
LTVGLQSDVHDIIDGSRFNLGWAAVLESRDPTLIEPLRTALEGYRARIQISVSSAYGAFADACLAVERINDAAQALESAFDLRGEDRSYDSELLRLRAMVLLGRAKSSRSKSRLRQEAEQTLEQAIEVANTQGTRLFALRATVDLCRLWLAAGKSDPARERLTEALSGFDDGPDETDVREASVLLETCK